MKPTPQGPAESGKMTVASGRVRRDGVWYASAAAVCITVLTAAIGIYFQPWNVDESMRAVTVKTVARGMAPLVDFATANFEPAWWLVGAPLLAEVPDAWVPLGARVVGAIWLLLDLLVWAWVARRYAGGRWPAVWLVALAGAAAVPTLLLKITEFRPDAAAAACFLMVPLLTFNRSRAARLVGLAVFAIGLGMRSEAGVALVPWMAAVGVEVYQKRRRAWWLLAPVAIATLYALQTIVVTHGHPAEYVETILSFMTLASLGHGATNLHLPWVWWLVLALGSVRLFWLVWQPKHPGDRAGGLYLLGLLVVTELLYSLAGARFLQNHWLAFNITAPFAALAVVENLPLAAQSAAQSRWFAAAIVAVCVVSLGVAVSRAPRPTIGRELPHQVCEKQPENTEAQLRGTWGLYHPRRVPDVVRFQRWVTGKFGRDAKLYANDFLASVGRPVPENSICNFEMLFTFGRLWRSGKSRATLETLRGRFPQTFFTEAPADYLAARRPDLLVVDPMLTSLSYTSRELCRLLREDYQLVNAPGGFAVYVAGEPESAYPGVLSGETTLGKSGLAPF